MIAVRVGGGKLIGFDLGGGPHCGLAILQARFDELTGFVLQECGLQSKAARKAEFDIADRALTYLDARGNALVAARQHCAARPVNRLASTGSPAHPSGIYAGKMSRESRRRSTAILPRHDRDVL